MMIFRISMFRKFVLNCVMSQYCASYSLSRVKWIQMNWYVQLIVMCFYHRCTSAKCSFLIAPSETPLTFRNLAELMSEPSPESKIPVTITITSTLDLVDIMLIVKGPSLLRRLVLAQEEMCRFILHSVATYTSDRLSSITHTTSPHRVHKLQQLYLFNVTTGHNIRFHSGGEQTGKERASKHGGTCISFVCFWWSRDRSSFDIHPKCRVVLEVNQPHFLSTDTLHRGSEDCNSDSYMRGTVFECEQKVFHLIIRGKCWGITLKIITVDSFHINLNSSYTITLPFDAISNLMQLTHRRYINH